MAWDAAKPSGQIAVQLLDDQIREKFDFLEAALKVVSFFARNTADASVMGLVQGAARLTVDVAASRPVYASSDDTGKLFFASDTLALFICTNGTTDVWKEIGNFGAALTAAGAVTLNGAVALNEDLTLATAKKLIFPAGEASMSDDATPAETMIPLSHGSRHSGIAGTGKDQTPNLITDRQNLRDTGGAVSVLHTDVGTEPDDELRTVTLSYAARAGTSHGYFIYGCRVQSAGLALAAQLFETRIRVSGGADLAGTETWGGGTGYFGGDPHQNTTSFIGACEVTGLAASDLTYDWYLKSVSAGTLNLDRPWIIWIGLGEE